MEDYEFENNKNNFNSLFNNNSSMIESLIKEDIDDKIKESPLVSELWHSLNRNIKLSFLDKDDVFFMELRLENQINNFLMSKPPLSITFAELQLIDVIKSNFRASIKRSVGSNKNVVNERTLQSTQIQQLIRSNNETIQGGSNNSFFDSVRRSFK